LLKTILPTSGVPIADNEASWPEALAKLAALVEAD
jgi:hypothetical protein